MHAEISVGIFACHLSHADVNITSSPYFLAALSNVPSACCCLRDYSHIHIHFLKLCLLQYMIPAVAATIHMHSNNNIVASIPIRMTKQKIGNVKEIVNSVDFTYGTVSLLPVIILFSSRKSSVSSSTLWTTTILVQRMYWFDFLIARGNSVQLNCFTGCRHSSIVSSSTWSLKEQDLLHSQNSSVNLCSLNRRT